MGQWIKYFADGTKYVGTDQDILMKRASWTKSKNTGIIAVSLEYNSKLLQICGNGNYWQADMYQCSSVQCSPILIKRFIQFQPGIESTFYISQTDNNCWAQEYKSINSVSVSNEMLLHLNTRQWLTLEYDIINNVIKSYIKDSKI
jgi:hypothetical protein